MSRQIETTNLDDDRQIETTRLANDRVIVSEYVGDILYETILDGTDYFAWRRIVHEASALVEIDNEIDEFFKPLNDAAAKIRKLDQPAGDPDRTVVLVPEVEHVNGAREQVLILSEDSTILRLIFEGRLDKLAWVIEGGQDKLVRLHDDAI